MVVPQPHSRLLQMLQKAPNANKYKQTAKTLTNAYKNLLTSQAPGRKLMKFYLRIENMYRVSIEF